MSESMKSRHSGLVGERVKRGDSDAIGQIVAVHYDQAGEFKILVRIEERLEQLSFKDFGPEMRPSRGQAYEAMRRWSFIKGLTEDEIVAHSAEIVERFKAAYDEIHELEATAGQLRAAAAWLRQLVPTTKKDQNS